MRLRLISLLASTALAAVGGTAFAADMGAKVSRAPAAVVAAPIYNWSGWYIGGNLGGGWSDANYTAVENTTVFGSVAAGDVFSHNVDGIVGGAQIGYNWQMANWVFGVEAMWDASSMDGSSTPAFGTADDAFTTEIRSLLLLTGRIGFATNNWLWYVSGGYAGADVRVSVSDVVANPAVGSGSDSSWQSGWTLGAGVEVGLTPNWTVGVDYRFVDLDTDRYALDGGAGGVYTFDVNTSDIHMLLGRINYRFPVR